MEGTKKEQGLAIPVWIKLLIILSNARGPLNVERMHTLSGHSYAFVTRIVPELLKHGLVVLEEGSSDKRSKLYLISEEGSEVVRMINRVTEGGKENATNKLSTK